MPRAARRFLKQMKLEEIEAEEVIIKTPSKKIIVQNPIVNLIKMGQKEAFQIMGEIVEESLEEALTISDEDVQLVAQQTGASLEEARKALEQTKGDLARAILLLGKK